MMVKKVPQAALLKANEWASLQNMTNLQQRNSNDEGQFAHD
jgi:hypothetical protein